MELIPKIIQLVFEFTGRLISDVEAKQLAEITSFESGKEEGWEEAETHYHVDKG